MKPKKLAILLGASLILSAAAQANTDAAGTSLKKTAQSESPYTSSTYTHADAFDGMTVYSGIDVSKFQPTIDWEKVKAAGTDFVIIRAGYRGYSSGSLQKDSCFESHVTGALAAGLKVGLYFYTEAINTTEAAEEAAYCIDLAKDYDITFPIAYDFELSNSSGRLVKANLSKSAATANCEAFCDAISDAGYTPMVYANKSDLTNKIDGTALSEKYGIWLAQYNTKATYTGTYQFWQYSSSGTVDGISGNVDCNFWYTSTSIDSNPFSTPSATDSSATQTSIEEAKFSSISKQTYTGNALTPTPALTLNGKTLTKGTDYTLSYTDNTNPGKATITAKGKGSYTGTVSAAFKIIPKAISTLKGKSASKAITLSWEEVALADGYEIYRKDSLNSSYELVKTTKKAKWKNTALSSDREYYYKVRAYAKVDNVMYYSSYTKLTAATYPGGKKAVTQAAAKLYKKSTAKGTVLATIPKNARLTYLGKTFCTDTKQTFHVKYTKSGKTYTGYLRSAAKLTF